MESRRASRRHWSRGDREAGARGARARVVGSQHRRSQDCRRRPSPPSKGAAEEEQSWIMLRKHLHVCAVMLPPFSIWLLRLEILAFQVLRPIVRSYLWCGRMASSDNLIYKSVCQTAAPLCIDVTPPDSTLAVCNPSSSNFNARTAAERSAGLSIPRECPDRAHSTPTGSARSLRPSIRSPRVRF